MSTTMEAAVHLGQNYTDNLEVHRNTNFEELQNLFDITQRLILHHQAEILNVSPIDWTAPSWTRSTLTHDQVLKWTKVKSTRPTQIPSYAWRRCRSIQKRFKDGKINSENYLELMVKIESTSCHCSRTSIAQREEIQKDVFQIPNNSRITRRDSLEDAVHSSAQETKRSGTELSATHLKEKGIPSLHRWWNASKKPVTQYSRASVN